jgi:hypothetical protein
MIVNLGDQIQQASAFVAAVREGALMLIAQRLEKVAGSQRKDAVEEMRAVLRLALPQRPDLGETSRDQPLPGLGK